jgi:hypothetical protein
MGVLTTRYYSLSALFYLKSGQLCVEPLRISIVSLEEELYAELEEWVRNHAVRGTCWGSRSTTQVAFRSGFPKGFVQSYITLLSGLPLTSYPRY